MSYLVKMMDGLEITVPNRVGEAILEAKVDRINWGKTMINLRSISSLIPYNDDEDDYLKLSSPKIYNKTERIGALEQLIKGLEKHIKENEYTTKSIKLLERMKLKLQEAIDAKESVEFNNPVNELIH